MTTTRPEKSILKLVNFQNGKALGQSGLKCDSLFSSIGLIYTQTDTRWKRCLFTVFHAGVDLFMALSGLVVSARRFPKFCERIRQIISIISFFGQEMFSSDAHHFRNKVSGLISSPTSQFVFLSVQFFTVNKSVHFRVLFKETAQHARCVFVQQVELFKVHYMLLLWNIVRQFQDLLLSLFMSY